MPDDLNVAMSKPQVWQRWRWRSVSEAFTLSEQVLWKHRRQILEQQVLTKMRMLRNSLYYKDNFPLLRSAAELHGDFVEA